MFCEKSMEFRSLIFFYKSQKQKKQRDRLEKGKRNQRSCFYYHQHGFQSKGGMHGLSRDSVAHLELPKWSIFCSRWPFLWCEITIMSFAACTRGVVQARRPASVTTALLFLKVRIVSIYLFPKDKKRNKNIPVIRSHITLHSSVCMYAMLVEEEGSSDRGGGVLHAHASC